jgi:hypothetical protein
MHGIAIATPVIQPFRWDCPKNNLEKITEKTIRYRKLS